MIKMRWAGLVCFLIFVILTSSVFAVNGIHVDRGVTNEELVYNLEVMKIDFKENGFNTQRFSDLIGEIVLVSRENDPAKVNVLINDFENLAVLAYDAKSRLDEFNVSINSVGDYCSNMTSVSLMENFFGAATFEFKQENYEGVNKILDDAEMLLAGCVEDYFSRLVEDIDFVKVHLEKNNLSNDRILELEHILQGHINEGSVVDTSLISYEISRINNSAFTFELLYSSKNKSESLGVDSSIFDELIEEASYYYGSSMLDDLEKIRLRTINFENVLNTFLGRVDSVNNKLLDLELSGVDVSGQRSYLNESIEDFYSGDLGSAEEILDNVVYSVDDLESDNILFGILDKDTFIDRIINWWEDNIYSIIIVFILVLITILVFYRPVSRRLVFIKIKQLERKEENIIGLIKSVQTKYFINKKLSKEDYSNFMDFYNEKLVTIRRRLQSFKKDAS